MSQNTIFRWQGGTLQRSDDDAGAGRLEVADSWLVTDGRALAIGLHRERFLLGIETRGFPHLLQEAELFWDATVSTIPSAGDWFPRVELRSGGPTPELMLRLRVAPARSDSVVVATFAGDDPRDVPTVKGPDLDALAAARESVAPAGEAILLTADAFVVEGAYSGLLWWRGSILCAPLTEFERIDSVTVRSVLALAAALGVETFDEAVTPSELDGVELWSLSALHGPRIVTRWIDGPALAELPGRLKTWRARLGALRQPL